jgi:hypothetical protein
MGDRVGNKNDGTEKLTDCFTSASGFAHLAIVGLNIGGLHLI